jgi:esterase/lipase superfamily enzyme
MAAAAGAATSFHVRVFFGTSRVLCCPSLGDVYKRTNGHPFANLPGPVLHVGVAQVSVRGTTCKIRRVKVYQKQRFQGRVARAAGAVAGPAPVTFIHGYNVSFNKAVRQVSLIASRQGSHVALLYSWGSYAALPLYPVDEGVVANYSHAGALDPLSKFLKVILGRSQTDLCCHSIGCRVFFHTVTKRGFKKSYLNNGRHIVLVAADIERRAFKRELQRFHDKTCNRPLTVYTSTTTHFDSHKCCMA